MDQGAQSFVDMGDPDVTGRTIRTVQRDPLDELWLHAASRAGWRVRRSRAVYAHWDGEGTLTVSDASDYDPDDTLAQFVFHEICHHLVEGPGSAGVEDWGLSNQDPDVWIREGATHRLQAALADRWGLRDFLAITGANRDYYDGLPADPIFQAHPTRPDESPRIRELAQEGWWRAFQEPWAGILEEVLAATGRLALFVQGLPGLGADSHWRTVREAHPLRLGPGEPGRTCGDCAWRNIGRCLQAALPGAKGPRVPADGVACNRHEPRLDPDECRRCGACCREGFSWVPVGPREPLRSVRPEWLERDGRRWKLPRPAGRCLALDGRTGDWSCSVYAQRPRGCSDLVLGGAHCLAARRRVGLSAGG